MLEHLTQEQRNDFRLLVNDKLPGDGGDDLCAQFYADHRSHTEFDTRRYGFSSGSQLQLTYGIRAVEDC